MKTRYTLALLIGSIVLLLSCKENEAALIYEKNEAKGKAVLRNEILETKDTSFAKIAIYLSANAVSEPYLYKLETNANGEYTLPYLPKNKSACIVGEYTGIDKIKYTGSIKQTDVSTPLILSPVYPRGKLKVTFVQSLTSNVTQPDINSRINAAEVYLFTNKQQAQSLLSAATPSGQFSKKMTNDRGVVLFYDLTQSTYYIIGKTTDSKGKAVYSEIKDASISSEADTSIPEALTIIPRINKTLTVSVTTDGIKRLAGAEVYLFKDASQITSLTANNGPFGVEKSAITQASGEAKFEDLTENSYYVGVRYKRSDGELFTSAATPISLTAAETTLPRSITITNTFFKVKVVSNSEPVYNATVYVFTSKTQAETLLTPDKAPTGFFRQATTQANGEATFPDIFSGKYYIGAVIPTADGSIIRKLKPDPVDAPAQTTIEL